MTRRRTLAASVALAVDNLGSGLYIPVAALFLIQVRGLSVTGTGIALGVGTAIGLAVPVLAGVLVDRIGPRYVLAAGQVLQALAMAGYLFLPDLWGALVSSAVFSAGMQLFYGSLFALLSALRQRESGHDRFFALIDMIRSGGFGAGAFLGAALLTGGSAALPWLLVGNLVLSLVGAVVVLTISVPAPASPHDTAAHGGGILRNRPFLGLILLTLLIALPTDFFLVAFPVVAVEQLAAPTWLPSLCVAILTLATSTLTVTAVRLTRAYSRAFALTGGIILLLVWIAVTASAYFAPAGSRPLLLVASTLVLAAGSLLIGTRLNAAAHDAAPKQQLGLYLAVFQYAFSVAALVAPLLLAAFGIATWLPWLGLAITLVAAWGLIPVLRRSLPDEVLGRARE